MTGASTVRRDFLKEEVVESSLEVEAHYIQIKVVPQKTSRESDKKHISDVAKDSSPEFSSVKMKILVLRNIFMVD